MSSTKKKVIFVVGNYGVGKSALIFSNVLSSSGLLLQVGDNLFVLGKKIYGADSLSGVRKEDVLREVAANKDKNIIIAGNYYCQIKDFVELRPHFDLVLCYLKTSLENNARRIAMRGGAINERTYQQKLKNHLSLIKKTDGMRKLYIIDNNRSFDEVKKTFDDIVKQETDEKN